MARKGSVALLGSRLVFIVLLWSVHHWDVWPYVGFIHCVTAVSSSLGRLAMCMARLSWLHVANETVGNFMSIWDNYWEKNCLR